eukprot:1104642-Pleurochrysis_carterae.AAC.1
MNTPPPTYDLHASAPKLIPINLSIPKIVKKVHNMTQPSSPTSSARAPDPTGEIPTQHCPDQGPKLHEFRPPPPSSLSHLGVRPLPKQYAARPQLQSTACCRRRRRRQLSSARQRIHQTRVKPQSV